MTKKGPKWPQKGPKRLKIAKTGPKWPETAEIGTRQPVCAKGNTAIKKGDRGSCQCGAQRSLITTTALYPKSLSFLKKNLDCRLAPTVCPLF